jgi:hypothetical protein
MYGIGQSSAYGAALMAGSVAGILATVLNQLVMYVFYYTIEKPHIKSIISAQQKLIPSISDQPVLIDSKEYEIYA